VASKLSLFLAELKRRKVTRLAVAYVIAGIAVVEGADIIGTPLGLSEGLIQSAAFLVVIGFPIALVLAWAVDVTPDGVRRTESITLEEVRPKAVGWWTPGRAVLAETTLVVVLAGAYFAFFRTPTPAMAEGRVPIAVLPFVNLSGGEEVEALTGGVHDDILTQLSKIHALRVTSRTSVMKYRNTEKNLRRIGEELGVRAILEGGVQKDQDRIRINAQLIDTETDEHLWAETYDREYTIGNLFAIQSDLAEKITEALHATLRPEEAGRIAALPTQDSAAYGLYLRGRDLYSNSPAEHETAMELFRQATRLDPEFAAAYANLASAHYHRVQDYGYPVEWADTVVALAGRALDLDPELANAHNALALGYALLRRHEEASEEYLRALDLDPSYSSPLNNLGALASDLGRFDESYEWFLRAIAVDPRSEFALTNAGSAASDLEMYNEAAQWLARAGEVDPDFSFTNLSWVILELSEGRVDEARDRAEAFHDSWPGDLLALVARLYVAFFTRDLETTLELEPFFALVPDWGIETVPATIRTVGAWAHLEEGETEEAYRLLEEARVWLEEAMSRYGPEGDLQAEFAALCALEGDREEALRWLEGAFEAFGGGGHRLLRMDPRFDSLSSDPRFDGLLERMEAHVAAMRGRVERGEVDLGIGG
jgi:TolB-like protein/Tfp pilus assembly protein PilF